jgi:cytochrome c biogenesis protein
VHRAQRAQDPGGPEGYKENIREQACKAFHHRAEAALAETPKPPRAASARRWPKAAGRSSCSSAAGGGWMVAAKRRRANKLGYLAAHSAIVLVCLGGLLDGDLIVRAQMWWGGKTPYTGGGMIADVPAQHRLSAPTPPSAATCWWPRARSRPPPS